jgi:hypothetical protein
MFAELPEECEREPAAYSRYEGSYEGQNARAEMIPVSKFMDQSAESAVRGFMVTLYTFEPVSTFLRRRRRQSCTFAGIVEIKDLDRVLKSAIQPSSCNRENRLLVV